MRVLTKTGTEHSHYLVGQDSITPHHAAQIEFLLVGDRGNKDVPKVAKPQIKEESYTPSDWLQLKHSTVTLVAIPALQRQEHIHPSQSYMVITLCQKRKYSTRLKVNLGREKKPVFTFFSTFSDSKQKNQTFGTTGKFLMWLQVSHANNEVAISLDHFQSNLLIPIKYFKAKEMV